MEIIENEERQREGGGQLGGAEMSGFMWHVCDNET